MLGVELEVVLVAAPEPVLWEVVLVQMAELLAEWAVAVVVVVDPVAGVVGLVVDVGEVASASLAVVHGKLVFSSSLSHAT